MSALNNKLLPIALFSLVAAPLCWAAAWLFHDRIDFSNALIGLGCLPIVVFVCAYLYLLVQKPKRG